MIDYQSLETTPFTALHGAWVRAFSDYQVAVDMPLWKLERMLTRRGYVPELSMGAFVQRRTHRVYTERSARLEWRADGV